MQPFLTPPNPSMSESTAALGEQLDLIMSRLAALESGAGIKPPAAPAAAAGAGASGDHAFVVAYDAYCASALAPFVAASDALGGGAATCGAALKTAWDAQRVFLVAASKSKKPADATPLQAFFKPYMDAKETIRPNRDDWELHMKTCGEVFGLLQWIVITPKPKEYAAEMVGACDFWSNKLRVQFKGKDEKQIAWVDALKGLLQGLVAYIKDHHLAGVAYNMTPKGGNLADFVAGAAPAAAAPAAAAKPAAAKPPAGGGAGGIMAELAKKKAATGGDSAASGLKTVGKDQQTWRADYKADKPAAAAKPKVAARAGPKSIVTGPPVCEFKEHGMKWCVENQQKENGVITIEVTDPRHQVYIYKCDGATIDIKGKCKGVVIDTAVKTAVLMDTVISSCETVNCKRMQVQVRGMCPSVAIDKTDGILVYLSKETAGDTTFVTSKSSEMNVSWPDNNDDMQEKCIPEQFQHKLNVDTGSISSDISDLYSH